MNDQPLTRRQPITRSRLARRFDDGQPTRERRRRVPPAAAEQRDFVPPTPEGTVTLVVDPPKAPEPEQPREEILEPLTLNGLLTVTLAMAQGAPDTVIVGTTTTGEEVALAAIAPRGDQS